MDSKTKRSLVVAVVLVIAVGIAGWQIARRFSGASGQGVVSTTGEPVVPDRPEFARDTDAAGATKVYRTSLPTRPGAEWSEATVSRTLKSDRTYLGDFPPLRPVTLKLEALPPHKLLQISFDLLLMRSWDGSSKTYGFSLWKLDLDGRSLVNSSFGNCGFFSDNNEQSFPDPFPMRPHPAWTGALEHETLGIIQNFGGGPDRSFDCSSVYRMVLTVPHEASTATFTLMSQLKKPGRKPWGISNIEVQALPELANLSNEKLTAAWKDLGGADPLAAYKARWDLVSCGDQAVKFIEAHWDEKAEDDTADKQKLIRELLSASNEAVPAAQARAVHQGRLIAEAIDAAAANLVGASTGEVDPGQADPQPSHNRLRRVKSLITRYGQTPTEQRLLRTNHLLAVIGSPAAEALLEKTQLVVELPDPE